jgi:hypothetical protein
MKRIDFRIVIGVLLIIGSLLGFLEKFGVIQRGWDLFWGTVFGLAGAAFLYIFFTNRAQWWAAIPAFTLLGMSASAFLLDRLGWGGFAFLGGIGLGFWAVYFSGRERWWAIIPGGVLLTLGVVSALSEVFNLVETGGVFFIGLGVTFLLVALLPGTGKSSWAYIPAAVLIILGILLGTPFQGVTDYIWIAALFVGGAALIWQYFRTKE